MAKPCQIRVLSNGKYCCEVGQLEVYSNCIGKLTYANLPLVTIEYEVTEDNWIPAEVPTIVGAGCTSLLKAGTYRFDIDCEALNGTDALEEGAISFCYECCKLDADEYLIACLAEIKALLAGGSAGDATALATIIAELQALCKKLLTLIENIGDLSEVCDKLEALIEALGTLCDKIEEGFESMEAILTEVSESLETVIEGLETICTKLDTLHADNEAICEKLDAANTSLEALCDKLDAILAAVIATTAAIALLKECNTAENEVICEKLEALLEQGVADAECLTQIKTLLEGLTELPVGVHSHCFAETAEKKIGYDVSDFDPADLEIGDTAQCNFSVAVDDAAPTFVPRPIPGVTFTDNGNGQFTASFVWDGTSNPQKPLIVDTTLSDGSTGVIQGTDFFLCSGAGESALADFETKVHVKELCFTNAPSIYQNEQGEPVEIADLTPCVTAEDLLADVLDCLEEGKTTETIQCWKDKFIEGGLDNTFTNFRHTGQIFTVTFDNGDVDTFGVPSATGWTDQVQQMATGLDAIMPWAQTVEPFCNITGGCGGLPGPVVELNQMFARYVGFRVCPGDKVPVIVEYTSDQLETPKSLVVQYVETDTIYIDRCVDCDGNETYLVDGEPYEPICAIPCEDSFPEVPLSVCSAAYLEGCDNVNSSVLTDFVPVIRVVQDCGSGLVVNYMVEEDSALVDYELVGQFVDCATGEPIEEPVQECDEPTVVRCEDPCDTGSTYINGRPPASNAWTWGPYSEANLNDFEAALTAAGYTVHIVGEKHQICPVFGAFGEDPNALVDNGLAEFAATVEPNINPAHVSEITCAELTVGKNDDLLLGLIKRLVENSELSAAKNCLMEEHLNPAGPCPAEVVTLDKEALTLTLRGDVTANYSAGQAINLQNANGEACGDATVAEGEGNVTLVDGNTVIKIVECELEEGKTPVQIVKATPISQPVKLAIATVKTLTAVKTFTTVKEVTR